jgi:hypothetical protein
MVAEDRIVRERYPTQGASGCLQALPGRNLKTIRGRAARLGVKMLSEVKGASQRALQAARPSARVWSEVELAALHEHYPLGGSAACVEYLPGRSVHSINTRASLLGIRLTLEVIAEIRKVPPGDAEVRRVVVESLGRVGFPALSAPLDQVMGSWTRRREGRVT